MTTICGKTLNETGERVLKSILIGVPLAILLIGLIVCFSSMHNTEGTPFIVGISFCLVGMFLGVLFLALTRFCECGNKEYDSPNERSPILV